ncbi:Uncharacterised protein [Cedecea neteri]|uniref:Uncharacterized protein n=1 Tax=Cedecea neteri TaxID=158822 RepID=A0A2X3KX27_9ENTR|nr:Uncharacterised protein [Cedecea neteri]
MAKLSLDALKIINLIKLTGSFSTTARLMNKNTFRDIISGDFVLSEI